jgi:hypothetical protein
MVVFCNSANAPSNNWKDEQTCHKSLGELALVLYEWLVVSHNDLKFNEEWTVSDDNVLTRKAKNTETKFAENLMQGETNNLTVSLH